MYSMRLLFSEALVLLVVLVLILLEELLLLLLVVLIVFEMLIREERAARDGGDGIEVFNDAFIMVEECEKDEDIDKEEDELIVVEGEDEEWFNALIRRRRVLMTRSIFARALTWAKFHFCSELLRTLRR